MFPRLPRVLRLALFAVCLCLSLLFMLRAGGDHPPPHPFHSSYHLLHHHPLMPSAPHTPRMSALRGPLTTTPKPRVAKVYRKGNDTAEAEKAELIAKASTEMKTTTLETFVNPHPFSYLINPRNACRTERDQYPVKMLIYIHSAPDNFKKRMSIRDTWGEKSYLRSINASLVFIMGSVPEAQRMDLVKLEHERFGDIVQEDFLDTYRNLTYKAIAGLKWASAFCPNVTYILKTDDDILVNMPRLLHHIRTVVELQYGHSRLILCNRWVRMKILRDSKSKWYIPEKDLKGDFFPPYCSGSAFLLSGDMARLMYRMSLNTPFFWVDDYYITGTLLDKLKIVQKHLPGAYSLNPSVAESKFQGDQKHELLFFHLHKLRTMYNLWANMSARATVAPPVSARAVNVTRSSSVPAVARAA